MKNISYINEMDTVGDGCCVQTKRANIPCINKQSQQTTVYLAANGSMIGSEPAFKQKIYIHLSTHQLP